MKIKILTFIAILITGLMVYGQCSVTTYLCVGGTCSCTETLMSNPTGTLPIHYQWSTGDTIQYVPGQCSGTYTLTITDGLGCIASDTLIVPQLPNIICNLTSTAASCPTCCDACITFIYTDYCSHPPSFSWSPNNPTWPTPCIACAGMTYTVYIMDACGCTCQASITPSYITADQIEYEPQDIFTYQIIEKRIVFSEPIGEINVFDELGQTCLYLTSHEIFEVNCSNLKTGIYIISAKTKGGQGLISKIIIR
jgi:hypothetical protein